MNDQKQLPPETDAAVFYADSSVPQVNPDFARKLERERDEARAQLRAELAREKCDTCEQGWSPSLVESGQCVFCTLKAVKAERNALAAWKESALAVAKAAEAKLAEAERVLAFRSDTIHSLVQDITTAEAQVRTLREALEQSLVFSDNIDHLEAVQKGKQPLSGDAVRDFILSRNCISTALAATAPKEDFHHE